MVTKIRKLLIKVGKVLPFVICFITCLNFIETAFATATSDFLVYDGIVIPNTPISFFIGQYFEYNVQMLAVLIIISIAIETCIYNKLACVYLGVNLAEKSYFDFELDIWQIYTIATINLLVSGYFTYKGIRILTNSQK